MKKGHALVRSAGLMSRRSVRRNTYVQLRETQNGGASGDPYAALLTSPTGRSGARDEREGGGVLLGLIARAQVFWADLRSRIAGEVGAIATEYVLLLILIAVVIIGTVTTFGLVLRDRYQEACGALGPTCP